MTFKKNSPGCANSPSGCGCGGCTIGSDALAVDLSAWTVSGTATISGGVCQVTAPNTVLIFDTQDATGGIQVRAQVDITGATTGDQIRIRVKDKNNGTDYWYGELTIGATGKLRIFKVIGGAPTQLATVTANFSASTTYTLGVCYGDGEFKAFERRSGTSIGAPVTTNISDQLYAGLSTGTVGSLVTFANFSYSHGYNSTTHPTCTKCQCGSGPDCLSDYPAQVDVTLPLTWSDGTCTGCTAINGATFTLPQTATPADPEYWEDQHFITLTGCGHGRVWLYVIFFCEGDGTCTLTVNVVIYDTTNTIPVAAWIWRLTGIVSGAPWPDTGFDVPLFASGATVCTTTGTAHATVKRH